MQVALGGVSPWPFRAQVGPRAGTAEEAGVKALCLPVAVGELFHPSALCWLLPGAPSCTPQVPSGGLRAPLRAPPGQGQFGAAFVPHTSFFFTLGLVTRV